MSLEGTLIYKVDFFVVCIQDESPPVIPPPRCQVAAAYRIELAECGAVEEGRAAYLPLFSGSGEGRTEDRSRFPGRFL